MPIFEVFVGGIVISDCATFSTPRCTFASFLVRGHYSSKGLTVEEQN